MLGTCAAAVPALWVGVPAAMTAPQMLHLELSSPKSTTSSPGQPELHCVKDSAVYVHVYTLTPVCTAVRAHT